MEGLISRIRLIFKYLLASLGFLATVLAVAVFGLKKDITNDKLPYIVLGTIAIGFIMLLLMRFLIYCMGKLRYLKSSLSKIDKMTGEEFEECLKVLFERKGYKVEKTPLSNDYGADLVCRDKYETVVVQAKRYDAHVGNSAVQEIVAARDYYEADRCIVVTNSYFTKNAVALALANEVELWDRDTLSSLGFKGMI